MGNTIFASRCSRGLRFAYTFTVCEYGTIETPWNAGCILPTVPYTVKIER
jgi:hypothetical protein